MLKRLKIISLVVLSYFFSAVPSFGCGDYGYDCGWDGLYSTGGYNLYSFGVDVYSYIDYGSTSNYGGDCGSLISSCNSCWDNTSLLGNSSYSNPNSSNINNLLLAQINQNSTQMCLTMGICNPNNPMGNIPPGIPGINPPFNNPPIFPPVVTNPPGFPPTGFPPSIYPPTVLPPSIYPAPWNPPPGPIPYGGCDNIIVMCPQGPVTRPPYEPPYTPPGTPNVNPQTYGPNTQTLPQSPVRYRVPRSAVSTTH